ncbi:MAG: hypothetical protein WCJ55_03060 [Chloroflexales bacterium]
MTYVKTEAHHGPRARLVSALSAVRRSEHVAALLFYLAISLVISWPTVAHFTTALTSNGGDARHELYLLWHTQQVLLGQQPLFNAPLLYYPLGATLLTHSTGPVAGLLALPFWFWGPAAAFNGTLLVGLTLSGYAMFLLARDVGLELEVALFAGCFVLAAPMTLAGLPEHLAKSFTAGIPLALLALRRALDPRRNLRWTPTVGLALLFLLLHNGYQFIYASLACGVMGVTTLLGAPREDRRAVIGRAGLVGVSALVLCAPLLLMIMRAARDPALSIAMNPNTLDAPELLQFVLPDRISTLFGDWARSTLKSVGVVKINWETAVALPWVGLALAGLGLARERRRAWPWLLLTLLCIILALGPRLFMGGHEVVIGGHSITLPYAYLRQIPGLEFMRTPGRFMMVGVVGFGIGASLGLSWLVRRLPRWRRPLAMIATALLLLQIWPRPFPAEPLRPVPPFYQQIAKDPAHYGVFDLPIMPDARFAYDFDYQNTTSIYQFYQITHHKGIAGGYLSRTYAHHPLFNALLTFNRESTPALLIDGQASVFASFQDDLARDGYRYVVLHKDETQPPDSAFLPGYNLARQLLDVAFAGQPPLVDDSFTTVYLVAPKPSVQLSLGTGWRAPESKWRWTTSPATLEIVSPVTQTVQLQITPVYLHDPQSPSGMGPRGVIDVQVGGQSIVPMPIVAGQLFTMPITLMKGSQTITLTLEAGSFRPSDYGGQDNGRLSFAVRTINIQTR